MEVIIRPTADQAARLVARLVADEVRRNPTLVLGLATGRTMERVYELLVQIHQSTDLDFSSCRTFNLDEYVGLSPTDTQSYRHYMDEHFFNRVNIDRRNTHLPDGLAPDLDEECRAYEARIRHAGGITLQLLGLGRSGHIGFNEPLSALRSRTRVKALTETTIRQNATIFGATYLVPHRAITMGVGTILDARRILLLATGEHKAAIVAKTVEGPITAMISATALQLHERCTVIVDEAAAADLQGATYYRWIFDSEPEWEPYRDP
jgi:glucosamine-6-phosphate deaminase